MRRFKWGKRFAACGLVIGSASGNANATVFVVNSIADTGGSTCTSTCTLRQALTASNTAGGVNQINFAFTSSKFDIVIAPASALPSITSALTINGYSQSGTLANTDPDVSNAVLKIRLDGINAGAGTSGLGICHEQVFIKGLSITRFKQNGVNIGADALGVNCSVAGSGKVRLSGNFIGLTPNGATAAGNLGDGVFVRQKPNEIQIGADGIGGLNDTFAPADRNVIGGNGGSGIVLTGVANTRIFGTLIGTDKTGALDRGNGAAGIRLDAGTSGTVIGLNATSGFNTVRYNAAGIATANDATVTNNRWTSNRVSGNDALGIDLKNDGLTQNDVDDVDTGPNGLQNFPVMLGVDRVLDGVDISASLDVPPAGGSYEIGVYASSACDAPGGNGEGELFLASRSVSLAGGANQLFGVSVTTTNTIAPGSVITLTATGPTGSSEFSNCVPVDAPPLVVNVTDDNDPSGFCSVAHCSLRQALSSANFEQNVDVIAFAIPVPANGELLIQPTTPLPPILAPVTIDGYTQSGTAANTDAAASNAVLRIRVDGAGAGGTADGIRVCSPGVTVRGLALTGFAHDGIVIGDNCPAPFSGTQISGNFVGLASDGATPAGNLGVGVRIARQNQPAIPIAVNSTIGSSAAADRNVIANNLEGVAVEDTASVLGNLIGSDKSGVLDRGNAGAGVRITSLQVQVRIGAAGAPNLIRFNGDGIRTEGASTSHFWAYNAISDSGALGIDIAGDGVSANDLDDADTTTAIGRISPCSPRPSAATSGFASAERSTCRRERATSRT